MLLKKIQNRFEGSVNIDTNGYRETQAFLLHEGDIHPRFAVRAGVMQGCPLAAVLFVLRIDPLLWALSNNMVLPS